MKYIYDENGNLLAKKHQGTDEEFKLEFGEDVFIPDEYLGELAIINNGGIRAITRLDRVKNKDEELIEGEYIKKDEIIKVEKPDNFHVWDIKKKKWIYDKDLEINSLYEITAGHEQSVQNLEKELKEAQENNRRALVRSLTTKIEILKEKITENYKKLDELEE